ncbi:glycoprotein 3-alpha-L-fucosyltransferase A-like [Paramacrobiotus metropolitanus]|uniref:glycoprotein 3-alpha-L-fucosyltransferase A-like n=1 Tax=Paramacrobiotus metropolitanus TaxID=2943436 RepID=UPI00244584FC|nr:glycoprotein 3-alpha-L-fucosyltransferase A-like [Paramacrobiotus metropolitanus]XP_055335105.1 glycoprotein 3-alpha-L-fucosyltransferase A-like [Paramacrobiotus metropolitanus]XP_055335114.1 glycoprotein 3-alpha-L-fucosyltransferase A-like [Paramacrobiotus metropolitanus]XP_055335122.1 glycoprotein 3-alpha-L-fucosyltransferase A-like [Paramacrobiotus metropolitanus]
MATTLQRLLIFVTFMPFFTLFMIMVLRNDESRRRDEPSPFDRYLDTGLAEPDSQPYWPEMRPAIPIEAGDSSHINRTISFRRSDPVDARWYLPAEGDAANYQDTDILIWDKQDLWPEQNPLSDRIENQLIYRPATAMDYNANDTGDVALKTIYLPEGYSSWGVEGERKVFVVRDKCPVNTCRLTDKANEADTADAVLMKPRSTTQRAGHLSKQIWIMYALESPFHTPSFTTSKTVYNWTATYRLDSDIVAPYEKYVLYNPAVRQIPQKINYAGRKTGKGKVAWFVSNCNAKNNRLDYARQLAKYISVDIYGSCGNKKCSRFQKNCEEMLQTDYKFYLAFENSNCRWYITEKFWINALGSNIVPIVMGAPLKDYQLLAPYKSFIHVDQFPNGPQELAEYLHKLDSDDNLYNEYFQWKGAGQLINTFFYCRLCALLHSDRAPKTYADMEKWWRGEGVCV